MTTKELFIFFVLFVIIIGLLVFIAYSNVVSGRQISEIYDVLTTAEIEYAN